MATVWIPLIWLAVAAMLLTLELAQPSFDGLMFAAIAALMVSAVTAIGPLPVVTAERLLDHHRGRHVVVDALVCAPQS